MPQEILAAARLCYGGCRSGRNLTIARRSAHSLIFPRIGIYTEALVLEVHMGEKKAIEVPFIKCLCPSVIRLFHTKLQIFNIELFSSKSYFLNGEWLCPESL